RIDVAADGAVAGAADESDAAALARARQSAAARLDPASGRVLQAVWLDAGPSEPGRLVIVIHHLAVDGVSWRILLADLAAAASAVAHGSTIALPPATTSFSQWSTHLHDAASERRMELPYWLDVQSAPVPRLLT